MASYNYMMSADEVAQELNCSKSHAYKLVKALNKELAAQGYITMAGRIEKGVEPLLIRDRLGHKDIRITLNTYGHLYPNQQRKIANLLDNENGNAVTGLGEERDEC